MPAAPSRLVVMLSGALAAACSSAGGGGATGADPTSERTAFSYSTNLIPVDVSISSQTGTAFIDTGNPFILLNPTTYTSIAGFSDASGGDVSSLSVGGRAVDGVHAFPYTALGSPDPAFPLAASIGCAAVCSLVATFNYRDVAFTLGPTAPAAPAGLEPESVFDFSFEGGSVVEGVTLPRSRIVLTVDLEGAHYSMIVDTGATSVTLSSLAYSALVKDGRKQLSGGSIETTSGLSSSSLSRAASVSVSGVTASSVVVAHDSSFDGNLQAISSDAGRTIDGSLGGTFLHNFYVTIDYPARKLHLARYTDASFAIDPAERLGIGIEQGQNGVYGVIGVDGDAAGKGVTVGDTVEAIDGIALTGLAESQATVLEFGQVGAMKQVRFGTAAKNSGQTLALLVEELLPLPTGM